MSDEEKGVEQTWAYMGRRLSTTGSYLYLWRDPEGKERVYTKLKASAPGHLYGVTVMPDGNVLRAVRYMSEKHPDESERHTWEADDRIAASRYHAKKAERQAEGELAYHLGVLREAYHSQRVHAYKAALLATFIEEITR